MKKLFLSILIAGLLLGGNAYAEIEEMQDKYIYPGDYSSTPVTTVCVDGYKFVVVRGPDAVGVTQAFEEVEGKTVPDKC
jgi:hypothetical protein|tara:strand:- start:448 stop:684 length:237 start_codon:yes stop_codon:yes gene_type:complete